MHTQKCEGKKHRKEEKININIKSEIAAKNKIQPKPIKKKLRGKNSHKFIKLKIAKLKSSEKQGQSNQCRTPGVNF